MTPKDQTETKKQQIWDSENHWLKKNNEPPKPPNHLKTRLWHPSRAKDRLDILKTENAKKAKKLKKLKLQDRLETLKTENARKAKKLKLQDRLETLKKENAEKLKSLNTKRNKLNDVNKLNIYTFVDNTLKKIHKP